MIVKKNNFRIKFEKADEEYVKKLDVKNIYSKIHNFFGFDKVIGIAICFLYSAEEYEFFTGMKFEKWHCGCATKPDLIFVFSPSVIEQLTTHKREEVKSIITHELAHIIYGNARFAELNIFNEGIASYLGEYEYHKNAKQKIKDFSFFKGTKDARDIYATGFILIDTIIEKFGKEKLFSYLKKVKGLENEEELKKRFKEVFGIEVKKVLKSQ